MNYEVLVQPEHHEETGWGYYRGRRDQHPVYLRIEQYVDTDINIDGDPIFVFYSIGSWWIGAAWVDRRYRNSIIGPFDSWEEALVHAKLIQDPA